jgi:hypothetical protein
MSSAALISLTRLLLFNKPEIGSMPKSKIAKEVSLGKSNFYEMRWAV